MPFAASTRLPRFIIMLQAICCQLVVHSQFSLFPRRDRIGHPERQGQKKTLQKQASARLYTHIPCSTLCLHP